MKNSHKFYIRNQKNVFVSNDTDLDYRACFFPNDTKFIFAESIWRNGLGNLVMLAQKSIKSMSMHQQCNHYDIIIFIQNIKSVILYR